MTPVAKDTRHWSFPTLEAAIQWVAKEHHELSVHAQAR